MGNYSSLLYIYIYIYIYIYGTSFFKIIHQNYSLHHFYMVSIAKHQNPLQYRNRYLFIWIFLMTPSGKDHSKKHDFRTSAATYMHEALTPERLDGTNYVEWSLNAQNKIRGRKCWGFISGTKVELENRKSDEYEVWEDENCLVKSWLLDSMTKEIKSLFIRLVRAKDIWDTVQQTYSVN